MNVKVKCFAGIAERVGSSVTLELEDGVTVRELQTAFRNRHPEVGSLLDRALVAVNRNYVDPETILQEQDEIALIPPVGGGSPEEERSSLYRRISDQPLSVEDAFRLLEDRYCGGTVMFVGTVREFTGAKQTLYLTYEAYAEMALHQMQEIENDVLAKYPGVIALQWHRVGRLDPTDIAVICAAAAPHRGDAFAAARELIERLKHEVPIWKKEFYANGDTDWRENEDVQS